MNRQKTLTWKNAFVLVLEFDRDIQSESGKAASKEGLACDAYLFAPTLSSQL